VFHKFLKPNVFDIENASQCLWWFYWSQVITIIMAPLY